MAWCFSLFLLCFSVCSCSQIYESPLKKEIKRCDFKHFTEPIFEPIEIEENIEALERTVTYPANFYTKISCNISMDMPIRNALIGLANQANISVCISGDVDKRTTISVKDKKFIDLLDDVCELCDLRYKVSDNSIIIENDVPYLETYDLQFLNLARESKGEIATANDVLSNLNSNQDSTSTQTSKNNSRIDNGSNSSVKGFGKNDFWQELETAIKSIINQKTDKQSNVAIHRQCGLISVITNSKNHKIIKKYIDTLKKTAETQVLIEAKILEVSLRDEYRGGIDWSSGISTHFTLDAKLADSISNSSNMPMFAFGYNGNNFSSVLKFMEKFGAIKTISNPRVTVMNNQSAVLKVAKNEIISKPCIYRQYSSNNDSRNADSFYMDIQTVPIGLIFTVQPAIDFKCKNIILTLRPTISRIVDFKKIPTYTYVTGTSTDAKPTTQTMDIPIVEVRELDSVLSLKSGQVVVLGGLMQEKARSERAGMPGTKNINVVKDLFNSSAKDSEITELIIFLRARIVDKNRKHVVHPKDAEYFRNYTNDTRPIL